MAILDDRCALVLGGASGIGQETARLFAREGARVVIGDIDDEPGQQTRERAEPVVAARRRSSVDVTDKSAVEAAIRTTVDRLGRLDVLVVTPFVNTGFDVVSLTPEDWHREINVLATGTLYAFQAAIPVMQRQGGGVLLATSSAHFGDYGPMTHPSVIPAYGSGKAAVELLGPDDRAPACRGRHQGECRPAGFHAHARRAGAVPSVRRYRRVRDLGGHGTRDADGTRTARGGSGGLPFPRVGLRLVYHRLLAAGRRRFTHRRVRQAARVVRSHRIADPSAASRTRTALPVNSLLRPSSAASSR